MKKKKRIKAKIKSKDSFKNNKREIIFNYNENDLNNMINLARTNNNFNSDSLIDNNNNN